MKFPSQNGRTNWEMSHYEFLSLTSFVLSWLSSRALSLQPNTINKLGVDSIQNICCLVNSTYLNFFVEQVISPFVLVLKVPLCKRFSAPVFVWYMWIVPVTAPMRNSTVWLTQQKDFIVFLNLHLMFLINTYLAVKSSSTGVGRRDGVGRCNFTRTVRNNWTQNALPSFSITKQVIKML